MAGKNLFRKPFDEGTLIKLKLYADYLKEWLPVFVSRKVTIWQTVQIFDFFAGQGKDAKGEAGSPLIALNIINSLKELIIARKIKLVIHLNELDEEKYSELLECVKDQDDFFELKSHNKDCQALFYEEYESMKNSANFLFLDQNGIKEITAELFVKIIELKQTDFIFFISSSYFKRFANTSEFQKYFPFDPQEMATTDYYHIHRKVMSHYKTLIPKDKKYYLAPFSIKKERNIYGLIFGTNHTLGIEKFLNIAWKNDKVRGEANYDIDNERIDVRAPSLFAEFDKPSKRDIFEKNLARKILNAELTNRYDVYLHSLGEGFLLRDANSVLKKMRLENKIKVDITYITSDIHKHKEHVPIII